MGTSSIQSARPALFSSDPVRAAMQKVAESVAECAAQGGYPIPVRGRHAKPASEGGYAVGGTWQSRFLITPTKTFEYRVLVGAKFTPGLPLETAEPLAEVA